MKIKVIGEVQETHVRHTFYPEDFNMSYEQWEKLTDEEKSREVQKALDGMPEQPYWVVGVASVTNEGNY